MPESMTCPFCNHVIFIDDSALLSRKEYITENGSRIEYNIDYYVYQCPNCEEVFIQKWSAPEGIDTEYTCINTYPCLQLSASFDERIQKISPSFIKTYNQSLIAESNQLTEITGLGFRKAFEILVKDYAIFLNPTIESIEILQMSLSSVITNFFEDTMFKPVFKKITWLGNDHSHTFNKHENYDVQDLKRFIRSCVSMIIAQLDIDELNSIEPKNN